MRTTKRAARYGRLLVVGASGDGHKELSGATSRAQLSYGCRCEKVAQNCECTDSQRECVYCACGLSGSVLFTVFVEFFVREINKHYGVRTCWCSIVSVGFFWP